MDLLLSVKGTKRLSGCNLFWSGNDEPIIAASRLLRNSGVRIDNIDKKGNLIQGRIGKWIGRFSCRIYVYLFPHPCQQTNLVETVCEFSWRQSPEAITHCLDTLRRNFETTVPDELKTMHRMRYLYIDGSKRPHHH